MAELRNAPPKGLRIAPPNWEACGTTYLFLEQVKEHTTAEEVLLSVDSSSRHRRGLVEQVERELLRSCCIKGMAVLVGIRAYGLPFFYVPKIIANQWLDAGGRLWIIAEINARSDQNIVAFPGGRR